MSRQLSNRCTKDHVHQPLVGGRCKNAAMYPLPLVRAILYNPRRGRLWNMTNFLQCRCHIVPALRNQGNSVQPRTHVFPKSMVVRCPSYMTKGSSNIIGFLPKRESYMRIRKNWACHPTPWRNRFAAFYGTSDAGKL